MGAALSFLGQKLFASSTLINARCENISCCTSVAAVQPPIVRRTGGFKKRMTTIVVRNISLYHPNSFGFLVPKPCKTAKFFNPLNVFPMSPVFVTTPFLVQKALKTGNSEKCVFRVLRLFCCLGLQIRSFSAENLLQVFAVLRNPFSSPKNRRCHRSLTRQPAEARLRVSQRLMRQPAEVLPT